MTPGLSRYISLHAKPAKKARVVTGRRGRPEATLQKAVVKALRKAFPGWYIHGSLMGVNLGPRKGAEAKAMGCMAGFPDVLLISPDGHVCFLELKTPEKNITPSSLSPEQREFSAWCEVAWGLHYKPVNSVEAAVAAVREWL